MSYRQLTAAEHLDRAEHHRQVGEALATAASHEWAAVPYFYAAYHLVKNALLVDPVFAEPERLVEIHPSLHPDHRFTSMHQARKSPGPVRDFGVNDLVLQLYRPTAGTYDRLHKASCAVRYDNGLAIPLERIVLAYESVRDAHASSQLVA